MPRMAIATGGFARRTALSVGILLITLVACGSNAAQSWSSPQATSPAAIRTVTLITGDRVVINGSGQRSVSVLPRKGREMIAFATTYQRMKTGQAEHLYVIPSDAQALIGAGRLDRQLFDMTTLLEASYDDAQTGNLSVVVTYESQVSAASVASSSLAGAAITRRFDSVNGLAAKVAKQDSGRFWDTLTGRVSTSGAALSAQNGPIKKIWLDRFYKLLIDQSVPQIGAPLAWQSGYDGKGVRVGIIDSGYDETHPDLIGKVVAYKETTIPDDDKPVSSNSLAADHHGHGTHVASTVAGTGAASNGKYRGVAPGADLVIFRACIPRPDIAEEGCTLARILEGMHWTVEEGGARIVSMSLGNWNDPNEVDPLEEAVAQLTEKYGVLFVIAAGNSGDSAMSIHTPGSSPAALTVGAVDKTDQLGKWSSRGPIPVSYDIKPDITAPGASIVAAWAKGTPGGPEGPVGEHYTRASGTSMATPHIAGAAAILLQRYPDWSPAQVKSALMSTARFHPALTLFDQGAGRVDVPAALTTSIVSDTPVLNLGFTEFPHEDDPIVTRTITYRNLRDVATTLTLNLDVRGSDGAAPPAGMFSFDRTTLTLPAGGMATVTLTANTRVAAAFGMFSGRLLATDGGQQTVAIPVALFRERPTYRVTLKHIDRNGAPTPDYVTTLVPLDEYRDPFPFVDGKHSGSGDITLRIPGGRYAVQTHFYKDPTTLLLYPEFVLDATSNLTLDARDASPLTITSPTPTAKTFFLRTEYQAIASWGIHAFGIQWNYHGESDGCPDNCRPPFYSGVLGRPASHIRSYVNEHWEDRAQMTATDGPALYTAAFTERGTLTTGTKTIPVAEMSVVRARYATLDPDPAGGGNLGAGVDLPGSVPAVTAFNAGVKFPHQRTEYYYSTEEDVRWYSAMVLNASVSLDAPFSTYEPRRSYITRWNEPPFAPVLPNYNPEVLWSYRTGDTMTVAIPILGDRQAHVVHMPLDEDTPGKLTLYRNGEKIAQSSSGNSGTLRLQSAVPAEFASYRIEADAMQPGLRLSTRVKGVWRFQSDHVAAGETTQLPLLTVRFLPTLNERGEAVRDPAFRIPVLVSQLDRQELAVEVNDLKIEASFDDGVSWKVVPVTRNAEQWLAVLAHPQQGEYVSLRASVKGLSANTAEITVIRAYGLTTTGVSTRK